MFIDAADRPVSIAGNTFGVGQLSAMQQFHISRRLAPLAGCLGDVLITLAKNTAVRTALAQEKYKNLSLDDVAAAIDAHKSGEPAPEQEVPKGILEDPAMLEIFVQVAKPISIALATMSDADTEYVVNQCLAVCRVKQGGAWVHLMGKGGQLMFQDLKMRTMLELTWRVIVENMGDVFTGPA